VHDVHTLSELVVGPVCWYDPAEQVGVSGVQPDALLEVEKSTPHVQEAHCRSLVGLGADVWYRPAEHTGAQSKQTAPL
jgi:hypothetical protein